MKSLFWSTFLLLCTMAGAMAQTRHPSLPAAHPAVPEGLGTNIHFTDPKAGEVEMLAGGGFTWIRMDFAWGATEREKGRYDFTAYERLLAALEKQKIKPLFILDYGNPLYDDNLSPYTEAGRAAFARWAAAATTHFKGRGVVWEMWNEPNISFWKPAPKVDDYITLALATGQAIRAATPGEAYIGAATSGVDLNFLEACFKAGLLEYWDAVSVHPYRQSAPETAAADYRKLRRLIAQYAPAGKQIPILSGEWGYSSVWSNFDETKQGKYLPRQWLTNLFNEVPISIWSDWHDDGLEATEPEHHFGTVQHQYHENRAPVYDPKPAYVAAQTLANALRGFRFSKRLMLNNPDDYLLLFSRGDEVRLAAWTTASEPHRTALPIGTGRFAVTDYLGKVLPALTAAANGLDITLTDAPQYLTPQTPNALLQIAARWDRTPLEITARGPQNLPITARVTNPLQRAIEVTFGALSTQTVKISPGKTAALTIPLQVGRQAAPSPVKLELSVPGLGRLTQETTLFVTNPLHVSVLPGVDGVVPLRVENPSGEALAGSLTLTDLEGLKPQAEPLPLDLQAGQIERLFLLPLQSPGTDAYRLGVNLHDAKGALLLATAPTEYRAVDDFAHYTAEVLPDAYQVLPDGDPKIASEQTLSVVPSPVVPSPVEATAPSSPTAGLGALKLDYRFDAGWKFVRVVPQREAMKPIEGRPTALQMWINGDNSGNSPRLRFTDATGQTFQPTGPTINWTGWRLVNFPLDGTDSGHWGGAADGQIHYPIGWDTLFLLDGGGKRTAGTLYIAAPTLKY